MPFPRSARIQISWSFSILNRILELAEFTNSQILDNYSKLAVTLFPAQPFSYLSRAKFLSQQQQFDEAIAVLEIGLDFLIIGNFLISKK